MVRPARGSRVSCGRIYVERGPGHLPAAVGCLLQERPRRAVRVSRPARVFRTGKRAVAVRSLVVVQREEVAGHCASRWRIAGRGLIQAGWPRASAGASVGNARAGGALPPPIH